MTGLARVYRELFTISTPVRHLTAGFKERSNEAAVTGCEPVQSVSVELARSHACFAPLIPASTPARPSRGRCRLWVGGRCNRLDISVFVLCGHTRKSRVNPHEAPNSRNHDGLPRAGCGRHSSGSREHYVDEEYSADILDRCKLVGALHPIANGEPERPACGKGPQ